MDYDKAIEAMVEAALEVNRNSKGLMFTELMREMQKAALAALQETMPEPEKNDHLNEYDMLLFNNHFWSKFKNLGK